MASMAIIVPETKRSLIFLVVFSSSSFPAVSPNPGVSITMSLKPIEGFTKLYFVIFLV